MLSTARLFCIVFHQRTLKGSRGFVVNFAIFLSRVTHCICNPWTFPAIPNTSAIQRAAALNPCVPWSPACLDMKNAKSKTVKSHETHEHRTHRRARKVKRERKEKKKKQKTNSLLKKMAATTESESRVKGGSSLFPQNEDDEIIVLYEKKHQSSLKNIEKVLHSEPRSVKHGKVVCSSEQYCKKQVPLNVEDIPLPPSPSPPSFSLSTPSVELKSIKDVEVESIPLPPDSGSGTPSCFGIPGATFMMQSVLQTLPQWTEKESCDELAGSNYARKGENWGKFQWKVEKEVARFKKIRSWEDTEFGTSVRNSSQNFQARQTVFSVMSYNVLAQQLLEDHPYLYQKHNSQALSWEHRSKTLLREIQEADADIVCLQEVQKSHLESFYSQVKSLGYNGLFKQRTNGKVDGCGLYFKSNKFDLLENTSVEYFQPGVSILDRDNVGIIARLQVKGKQQQLVVATTHLLYNPRRHDIKLAQTQLLLTELERISYVGFDEKIGKPKYLPVILTGDFNLEPGSAVYNFLVEGYLQYDRLAARSLSHPSRGQVNQETLLPPNLQVSNTCQHVGVLNHRTVQRRCSPEARQEELLLIQTYNTDHQSLLQRKNGGEPVQTFKSLSGATYGESGQRFFQDARMEPGRVSHNFFLNSVYKHQQLAPNRQHMVLEATTKQYDWITVDYIFYSGCWSDQHQRKAESSLKLLSRYRLPTRDECNKNIKYLPNLACGSDHLPLMARFLLMNDL